MFLPIFHASVVLINSYTIWYDQQYLDLPFPAKGYEEMPYKGRSMFMTMWCLMLHIIYFSISLLNDLIGMHNDTPAQTPAIRKFRDLVFSLAFPTAIYVSTGFWTIYSFDKELIFPDHIESLVPFWVNAVMHIFNAVFIVTEVLVTRISYPSRKVGLTVLFVFNLGYLLWMHILHQRTGKWAYPLFEALDLPARIVFFSICVLLDLSYYVLGEKLSTAARSKPKSQVNGVHKKSY